jgi:tetratricopeptide (TPR) repeat protein
MAIFNRALLHDKTGNLRSAIRDYTTVINQFPNFWTGLQYRASCYRRLGMTANAERDEFRIFKAQMDKHIGIQPRWSRRKDKEMRKRSEINPDKYNQLVVEDNNEVEHEYKSEYRGRVQDRTVEVEFMPMYTLSYFKYNNGVKTYQAFDREVESFNKDEKPQHRISITCNPEQLTEAQSNSFFIYIDTLSAGIAASKHVNNAKGLLLQRAVAYSVVQNYDAAISDLTAYIQIDSTSTLCYWQRAVCQTMMNEFNASQGANTMLMAARTMLDFNRAIELNPTNAYLYFDRGNLSARQKNYGKAIDDFTKAINIDPNLAEAYYNRGLARIYSNNKTDGITDLSKAGELGLYNAYSIIKRFSSGK